MLQTNSRKDVKQTFVAIVQKQVIFIISFSSPQRCIMPTNLTFKIILKVVSISSTSDISKDNYICIYIYIHVYTSIGEGNGTPLQYSCLENPMDGGAWWATVHGVAKSQTRLSDFPFTFHFHTLEKEMATHSSVLAWRIPGTGEPRGLPSMGSHRVGQD